MGQRARPIGRLAAALILIGSLAACGRQATGRARGASLVLDFTPNAIHAGIYEAIARHYDRRAGVALHVVVPGASTDAVKLLLGGRTDFAVLDIHDLAIAREQGEPLVGIMAIVERPLASVIAAPPIRSPRALTAAGRLVGVTGAPSDLAVLRSVVSGAGGAVAELRTVTIGYSAVADLLSRRVEAATGFWNDEGSTLTRAHRGFHIFRVDDYGAPAYPELVLCATRAGLRRDPARARGVVRALVRGYEQVLADPAAGAQALDSSVTGLSAPLVAAQLAAELPAFRPAGGGAVGSLPAATLSACSRWEARFGIVRRVPDVAAMFDRSFLPG